MTTTSWTTSGNVPLGPWAALSADLRTLLGVMQAGGAKVTNPAGNTGPVMTDTQLAFTVTLPDRGPLTVTFERAAGEGSVETSSPTTDGLVLVALSRAARAWGQLLTWTSDAGTEARAVCATVVDHLYGDADRAVAGGAELPVPGKVSAAIAEALDTVARAERIAVEAAAQAAADEMGDELDTVDDVAGVRIAAADSARYDLATYLGEVLTELDAHRDGVATATALLTPPSA